MALPVVASEKVLSSRPAGKCCCCDSSQSRCLIRVTAVTRTWLLWLATSQLSKHEYLNEVATEVSHECVRMQQRCLICNRGVSQDGGGDAAGDAAQQQPVEGGRVLGQARNAVRQAVDQAHHLAPVPVCDTSVPTRWGVGFTGCAMSTNLSASSLVNVACTYIHTKVHV